MPTNPFEDLGHDQPGLEPANSTADREPAYSPPPYSPESYQQPSFNEQQQQQQQPPPQLQDETNKIIAIPATDTPLDSPFLRAYPPALQRYSLAPEPFFAFLDDLNKVISTSTPLQVLDATGGVLNAVPILFPLHWIGSTLSGIANLSSQGMSKSRAESAIAQANKHVFGPHGLKVGIAGLDTLAHLAKIPILDSKGKVNKQAPLFLQLSSQDATGAGAELRELDRSQRLITVLQPWIAHLDVQVLPWATKSKLTRFNATLKKKNNPTPEPEAAAGAGAGPRGRFADRRDRKKDALRALSGSGSTEGPESSAQAESSSQAAAAGGRPELKKGLWLIISELAEGERL